MTLVNGTRIVDLFLRRNPRPRYIVFLYAPEDLTRDKDWQTVSSFEAISYRLEYERNFDTLRLLATHPTDTFGYAEQGLRMAAQRLRAKPFPPEVAHMREEAGGQYKMRARAMTSCDGVARDVAPDRRWIEELRGRYGVEGTKVLVDATPTAPCDRSLEYFRRQLNGVVDNSPYPTIPVESFVDEGRLHVGAEGSVLLSTMIADQVGALAAAERGRR